MAEGTTHVDWTGRFHGTSVAETTPHTTADVVRAVQQAREQGWAIHVQGGNTGLVGGSVPATERPTLLLRTTGLDQLGAVDPASRQVSVGAGVTLADLQGHAAASGWYYPVDLAARDGATVGGTVATNAGGVRVIRYGMTAAHVVGVEAVLADGSVIDDTSGLLKNNTGYRWSALLTGSEGTLGIITRVRVALELRPCATTVAMLPVDTLSEAVAVTARLRGEPGADLLASEVLDAVSCRLWRDQNTATPLPCTHRWLLLLEVADGADASGLAPLLEDTSAISPVSTDSLIVATSPPQQRRLWQMREGLSEAYARAATESGRTVVKLDVSLPAAALDEFVSAARRLCEEAPGRPMLGVFGHVGDGNLHLEVLGPPAGAAEAEHGLLHLVAQHAGSISAEHGIGRAKRNYLPLSRSQADIAAMRAVKKALDPDCRLNPGILLPQP